MASWASSTRLVSQGAPVAADAAAAATRRSHLTPFAVGGSSAHLNIARSEGVMLYSDKGDRYLDGLAGLWSTLLGGSEPRLKAAATKQMDEMPYFHNFWGMATNPAEKLADELREMYTASHMARVTFTSSGSEANDTLVKLIRYYNNALGRPNKKKLLARDRGYHGSTFASASLTGLPHLHKSFDLPMDGVVHVGCPDFYRHRQLGETEAGFGARMAADLRQRILDEGPDTVAALWAEPVQGAGGVIIPPQGYWEAVQKTLKEFDVLLVADEVVTGFGRVGSMFGSDAVGMHPDAVVLAKGITSAYVPLGAAMISPKIAAAIDEHSEEIGMLGHGFTYAGHPVACAVALEAMSIYKERDLPGRVASMANGFNTRLHTAAKGSAYAANVRSMGFLGAMEWSRNPDRFEAFPAEWKVGAFCGDAARARGILVRSVGDIIAVSPALIITEAELDELFDALRGAVEDTDAYIRERMADEAR